MVSGKNVLTDISGNTFANLELLNLTDTSIGQILDQVREEDIQILYLRNNNLTTANLPNLTKFTSLREIAISDNPIDTFTLANMPKLTTVSLDLQILKSLTIADTSVSII